MSGEQTQRERELLRAALQKEPAERSAFLSEECGTDTELRQTLEELLVAADVETRFPELRWILREAVDEAQRLRTQSRLRTLSIEGAPAAELWGSYRLLEKLGEGGMGEVHLADQVEPIRRKVALKIIKSGMQTRELTARFETERQALAMMDHPSIAKVLDAGIGPSGQLFFTMEYVPGVPITEHCDTHRLDPPERLALFQRVCEGVQHAHQKAVIHRDLKPSNILVSTAGGEPVPKIIDFGVAKATNRPLTEMTLHTRQGNLIGTPSYMSPEQIRMTGQSVDTRTDVYSLGVVLYELLVGTLPFKFEAESEAAFDEVLRRIREEEPAAPSTHLRLDNEETQRIARARNQPVGALRRQLKGDLDSITLRALEKDPARRYASPLELSADIQRYLNRESVLATPPSLSYRALKFVRRHRISVTSATLGLVSLMVFVIALMVQANRIAQERDRANEEADIARESSSFLVDLFKTSDPTVTQGQPPTARELLDRGAQTIQNRLHQHPATGARLREIMAEAYSNLGAYDKAEALYESAMEIERNTLGPNHPETLGTQNRLGATYWSQGRLADAERLLGRTVRTAEIELGREDPITVAAIGNLGSVYYTQGRYAEAEERYRWVWEVRKKTLGEDHAQTLGAANNLERPLYDSFREPTPRAT